MDTPATTVGGVSTARMVAPTRRARVAMALVATLVAGLMGGLGGTTGGSAALADDLTRVIVQARQDLGAVAAAVARQGGEVVEVLAPFQMVVADVPDEGVAPLEADPATGAVTPDQPMTVQSADDVDAPAAATAGDDAVDPDAGDGVGVVLVDTGIADHDALDDSVVARYDLSPSRDLDGHGHGTFMAGIVHQQAPGSDLVSVQVAGDDGSTSLTRVLHGLAIADAARDLHDAPVVLLAMAGDPGDAPDPIMTTLEMLWARGSTVVVPSGNRGKGEVTSPGTDPYLITVGAVDEAGKRASWSGEQRVTFGDVTVRKPEIHARGVGVEGLVVEGSTIAGERTAEDTLTGSGTSMAAAHVAGRAAAVIADAGGHKEPDAVKLDLTGVDNDSIKNLGELPEPVEGDQGSTWFLNPGAMQRSAKDLQPQGWSWTGWSWTGWSWTGWSWTSHDTDGEADWAGWSWTGEDFAGWSWTGWSWTGWSWTGWSWTGWSWTGWSWTATEWGGEPTA